VVVPVGALVLIPFFHSLDLVTAYTYFELRFGRTHRTIAALLFLSRVSLYLGVVLYAPALLLHTCLAFPLWATILFTGCLSTLWTIKGGMFAVVYTDAIQSIAMIIGGAENAFFRRRFGIINDLFAKTGSGQTRENAGKGAVFSQSCPASSSPCARLTVVYPSSTKPSMRLACCSGRSWLSCTQPDTRRQPSRSGRCGWESVSSRWRRPRRIS
jgi:Na+(H+)/acetate symporter ActP